MTSAKQRKITLCIYIVAVLTGIIVLLAFYVFQKGPFLYYKFEENLSYNGIRFEKLTDDARDSCFYIPRLKIKMTGSSTLKRLLLNG